MLQAIGNFFAPAVTFVKTNKTAVGIGVAVAVVAPNVMEANERCIAAGTPWYTKPVMIPARSVQIAGEKVVAIFTGQSRLPQHVDKVDASVIENRIGQRIDKVETLANGAHAKVDDLAKNTNANFGTQYNNISEVAGNVSEVAKDMTSLNIKVDKILARMPEPATVEAEQMSVA